MLRNNWLAYTMCGALALAMTGSFGCSNSDDTPALSGVFIDGPVQGLRYTGPNHSGTTDATGAYDYEPGDEVCFFIDQLPLGCLTARGIVTPIDLFEGASLGDDNVTNMVRLLMSLDADDDPDNGLDVSGVTNDGTAPIDFDQTSEDFGNDSAVQDLVDNELVDEEDAESHLEETVDESFYHEQALVADWVYSASRFEGGLMDAGRWSILMSDLEDISADATENEEGPLEISFELSGSGEGETCVHEGQLYEYEDGMVSIYGEFRCTIEGPLPALVEEEQMDGYFSMDNVIPGDVFSTDDLDSDYWYLISRRGDLSTDWDELDFDGPEARAALNATVAADGAIHFERLEPVPTQSEQFRLVLEEPEEEPGEEPAMEECVYDGQLSSTRWTAAGSVVCSASGEGVFFLEED